MIFGVCAGQVLVKPGLVGLESGFRAFSFQSLFSNMSEVAWLYGSCYWITKFVFPRHVTCFGRLWFYGAAGGGVLEPLSGEGRSAGVSGVPVARGRFSGRMLTGMLVAVFLFLSGILLSSGPALADEGEDAMSGATTVLSTDAEASSVEASEEFAEEAVSALSTAAVNELSEETTESVEDTKLPVTVDMEDLSEHFTSGYGLDWYLFPTGPDGEWVYGE